MIVSQEVTGVQCTRTDAIPLSPAFILNSTADILNVAISTPNPKQTKFLGI
jgi:hypothetical protein